MTRYTHPVLVVGGNHTALGVIRDLGRQGIAVYCAVERANDFAIHSRYCKGYIVNRDVISRHDTLQHVLQALAKRGSCPPVLHPTSDLAVLNATTFRDQPDICLGSIPPRRAAEILIDKKQFYRSLQAQGIPYPATFFPDETPLDVILPQVTFPVLIKPSMSHLFQQRFRTSGFIANTSQELRQYLRLAQCHHMEVMIQQIIHGPATNHYEITGYFDQQSQPRMLLARQLVRKPATFTLSSAQRSIPMTVAESLKERIVNYLTALQYHGIFGSEFKRDPVDAVCKLLDLNARSEWYSSLMTASGVNCSLMAYREAIGETVTPQMAYKAGVYGINVIQDLSSVRQMLRHRRFNMREILYPYRGHRHWFIYARDDPLPFVKMIQFN